MCIRDSTSTAVAQSGAKHSTPINAGTPMIATSILCFMVVTSLYAAEPAIPPLIVDDRSVHILPGKIRPQRIAEIEFAVGTLPQHEIAQPYLAAGADDQLRVRNAGRVQIGGKQCFVQVLRLPLPFRTLRRKPADSPEDLIPAAVVQTDIGLKIVLGQMLRDLVRLVGQRPQLRCDGRHVSKEVESDMVPLHSVHGFQQILLQKRHDSGDLCLRARPVFRGKGVDRQVLDADVLAVGGDPEARHGIVLTANYIAKQKGVKTGMALWQAKQICPEIIFVPPRMDLYLRFSKMAREIYSEYTDKIEPYGIDEAWLDVSDSRNLKGSGMTIAREISHRIKYELGVTVSIGISWNKIYAKLGSDYKKPDAITEFNRENYKDRIWQLPASDLLYVGRQTNKKLQKLGIRTIGQLAESDEKLLESHFGKIGNVLWAFANGWDEDPVCKEGYEAPVKSIGNSTTTPRDLENDLDVWIIQIALAESVAARLRKHGFKCKTVEITVRDNGLYSFSRQIHLRQPTNITNEIVTAAFQLFKDNYKWEHPIRSLGIRAADLVLDDIPVQLDLFGNQEKKEKLEKLDRTVDEIRRRFGYFSIQRAAMYQDKVLSHLDAGTHTIHPHSYFHR